MKRVYIIGKVSGEDYETCKRAFEQREKFINSIKMEAVNPIKLVNPETKWEDAMKICIKALLECDAYTCLNNWENSVGAKLEVEIAQKLKLLTITIID